MLRIPIQRAWPARLAAAAVAAFVVAACDTSTLLEVEDPDVTLPRDLFDSTNIAAVRALAVGDFGVAFGGASTTNGMVTVSGLLADEFFHSGTFQENREIDKRRISNINGTLTTFFSNLQRARRSTELAVRSYEQNRPNTAQHAEMINLAAFTYVFFAEAFCSGVPFSEQVEGRFVYGERETTEQIRARATQRFDQALQVAAQATGAAATAQQYLATIGKARVRVEANDHAGAAALVAGIPTAWAYNIEFSDNTTRQNNGVFGITQTRKEYGLAHNDGGTGLPYRQTPADPRLPWTTDGGAADAFILQFTPRKYDSRSAPIPLASGIEARLIEAEAALDRGQSAAYLAILNALRATQSLPALTDPGSAAARVDQFFAERAFWLWGTGHRLGDMRRLVRQYNRSQETVFPTGDYARLGTDGIMRPDAVGYGTDVNLPLPQREENNPLPASGQCLSRDA